MDNKMKRIAVIKLTSILFALALFIFPNAVLAVEPALSLSSNKSNVVANEEFTVTVKITVGDNGAVSGDAEINFPGDKLEIVGDPSNGGFFPQFQKTVNVPAGQVRVFGSIDYGVQVVPKTGSGNLANITFRPKSGASGQININIVCPTDYTGVYDLTDSQPLSCSNVSGTSINITTAETEEPGTTPSPANEQNETGGVGDTNTGGDDNSGGDSNQAALVCGDVCDSNNVRCPSDAPYCIEYENDNLPYRCGKTKDPKAGPSCSSTTVTLRPTRPPAGGTTRITPSRITPTPQPVKLSRFTPLALDTPQIPSPTPTTTEEEIGTNLGDFATRLVRVVLLIAIALAIVYIIKKLLNKRRDQSGPPPSTPSGPTSTNTVSLPPVLGDQQSSSSPPNPRP